MRLHMAKWEYFCDAAYYGMWAVREVNENVRNNEGVSDVTKERKKGGKCAKMGVSMSEMI